MIKLISTDMAEGVMKIYRPAIRCMEEMNIRQWDDIYPDKEIIADDIESGSMFGYFQEQTLCAVQVINSIQSPEYSRINWKYKDNNPLVLHRLCVSPEHWNKGIAKQMILFAEKYAEDNNYKTIRFDAFTDNPVSVNLYKKMGYINSGIVRFRKGDFYCFEKKTSRF